MSRDLELMRLILLKIEMSKNDESGFVEFEAITLQGYSIEQIQRHILFLIDGGYLIRHQKWLGSDTLTFSRDKPMCNFSRYVDTNHIRMSWMGAELVDQIREEKLWTIVCSIAKELGVFNLNTINRVYNEITLSKLGKKVLEINSDNKQ